MTTASGASLAADFTRSIRRGLQKAGYGVTTPEIGERASDAQVRLALLQSGAQLGLAVQIREWKSDTLRGTEIIYDETRLGQRRINILRLARERRPPLR